MKLTNRYVHSLFVKHKLQLAVSTVITTHSSVTELNIQQKVTPIQSEEENPDKQRVEMREGERERELVGGLLLIKQTATEDTI